MQILFPFSPPETPYITHFSETGPKESMKAPGQWKSWGEECPVFLAHFHHSALFASSMPLGVLAFSEP
jgi:hypothetical protein